MEILTVPQQNQSYFFRFQNAEYGIRRTINGNFAVSQVLGLSITPRWMFTMEVTPDGKGFRFTDFAKNGNPTENNLVMNYLDEKCFSAIVEPTPLEDLESQRAYLLWQVSKITDILRKDFE